MSTLRFKRIRAGFYAGEARDWRGRLYDVAVEYIDNSVYGDGYEDKGWVFWAGTDRSDILYVQKWFCIENLQAALADKQSRFDGPKD